MGEAQELLRQKGLPTSEVQEKGGQSPEEQREGPGVGDIRVSSSVGWRLFILCPCLHPLVSVWVGVGHGEWLKEA